ncbi:PAS domain S-box-containing protein [Peptoclostridium litorale DSM 5388]|uniref:Signal-transduction and transcriptional-control protein Stc n=1 Tax=Peptoclostridium litorale DSM 5388 TaxID=1121324 RepID=A0A069RQH2_PEPLI|nr:sigma-54-dependent Fis family transcriptional regulator [Peptoclostridium litorale]KDR96422.1 signal-transduction and transcriptional-control protein Stc [Peptoclostridium litorale DSM 5388]SIN70774.1 PAS domain S-box-containing protein [Peptoclostridium litorale DSM 5388]
MDYGEELYYKDGEIKKIILDSWRRCEEYGVDREHGRGKRASEFDIKNIRDRNIQLINVAIPIMKKMYQVVKGSGFSVMLTDGNGYLLEAIGDEEIMKKAQELNFVKGALWTEEAVGTNAIGTALQIDQPLQTIGNEHYCKNQHSWTCSAAPIHDDEGNIIGCIDMSGECKKAHTHTLGMVITVAYSIESQIELIKSNNLINATFSSIRDGMIIFDDNMNIKKANEKAAEILGYSNRDIIGKSMDVIANETDFLSGAVNGDKCYENLDCDFHTSGGGVIKCSVKSVPVLLADKTIGTVVTFKKSSHVHKMANKVAGYKAVYKFCDIVTQDEKMNKIIEHAKKVSLTDCSVLITGQSGTGKELFAQSIHNHSKRAEEPFIAINCASIPRDLMESELFGYEKGAFTGAAKTGRPGKFEIADGGTIFLDEIGEMPLEMQSKLLRFLDNKKISRIGGSYEKILDVRIIAATNRDLVQEISKKNFRQDLYYRLNVMNINIMSLAERIEDVELLAKYFVERLNISQNNKKIISSDYIEKLKSRSWKGNVRELQNAVARVYYLCEEEIINDGYDYEKALRQKVDEIKMEHSGIVHIESVEMQNIKNALARCGGNVQKASSILKMSRATIYRKIKKYAIQT